MSPGVGVGLLAHDDVVAVEDAGVDHGVAPDADHEELAVAGEVLRDGERLLDVLGREHAGAGGDVADEGDVAHRSALDRLRPTRVVDDLDGPGLGGVAREVALVLEGGEVGVHGGARGEPDGLADLADARRVPAVADLGVDELEDLALTGGQIGHAATVARSVRSGQTPVREFSNICS